MKILIVSSYLPYPLFSGGHIRLYNLMKLLSRTHELTLVCEKRDYQTQNDIEKVKSIFKEVVVVDRKKQWTFKNVIKASFSLSPFLLVGHKNSEMREAIQGQFAKNRFDLIHVETFYVMQNLPKTDIPIVLGEQNVEYLVYKRYASKSRFFLKPFLYWDVFKLKNKELGYWKKADKLIAVSPQEKELMKIKNVELVPNGVDIEKFKFKRRSKNNERRVLFIGDFKWIQNRDSVEWIIKEVWPQVAASVVSLKQKPIFWIVGKRIPAYLKNLKNDNVMFDENAPVETQLIFQEADFLLAPIRVGGGTSFKILEAMASGIPVLTNFLGNEGINAQAGVQIMICETAAEFAESIVTLMQDAQKYESITNNARSYIEDNFDWKNIALKLDGIYKDTTKND